MQLFFGMAADGRTFPDHPGGGAGAVDCAVVGPAGLIDALEAQLGLLGPPVPKAVRIAAYLAKLRAAGDSRFWSASFSKDSWSTAVQLLGWRDTLVAGGWTGATLGSVRLDDLAAAESAGAPMPAGLADRLAALVTAVGVRPGLRLKKLRLLEPRARFAPAWARLLNALLGVGVLLEDGAAEAAAGPSTDLGRVQATLRGEPPEALVGDGSFALLEADTALMAAEAVADWLAAGGQASLAGTVVLAPDGDTALLDHALAARGLPALGLSKPSPWRGALQVLPLAFAVAWRPFDPKALLNLLILPRPPIGRFAAGRLARVLVAEPGLDGPAWVQAWEGIAATLLENEEEPDSAAAARKVACKVEQWRAWTQGGQFGRADGMSVANARQIAGRVAAWAVATDAGRGDALFLAVAAAAGAFVRAIDALELEVLPALLIERVLTEVLTEGVTNPTHAAEAGGLRAICTPGALWAPAPRLVWWSFVGPGEKVASTTWSRAEQAVLAAAGVGLESAPEAAVRISGGYADVALQAGEQALFVRPALSGGAETVAHPLEHQLHLMIEQAGELVRWRAERLLTEPAAQLAQRVLPRAAVDIMDAPAPRARWRVPAAGRARLANRRESATSLGRLLNCQLSWFVQDVLRLRTGRFADIPGANQLFGNLAHEIANRLLPPGPPPAAADIRSRAVALFEELLPRVAAPLQQPEFAGELAAARERVPAALETLVRTLHARGLEVVGAELDREGEAGGLPLQGRLDLLVRQGATPAVIDLKWTRSARRYREEIAKGRALQLAVYGAIAEPGTAATGAYYLLRQRRLFAPRGSLLAEEDIEAVRGLDETLHGVIDDVSLWRSQLDGGNLLAMGVGEAADHRPAELMFEASKEPCRFCDLTGLCRVGVEAL
ncbi:PD-(D/E)XK nuclease family protein [Gluconobacter oxydans]|uniref:PD-(D/E)XK nuclease family protein n=1 Tax=Gluconobacter oxydans TaxID=442 RepID=UPI001CD871AC|nr:PD-(D/E)XK nuclease family protein [Gluconobacter oxydans]